MIRIRHSVKPHEELELEGSNAELCTLHTAILLFCESGESMIDIPADSNRDPSPYQHSLSGVRLYKNKGLILMSVVNDWLSISGNSDLLRLFANNLPHDAHAPYHVHFDRFGREDHMAETSLGIVLSLKN